MKARVELNVPAVNLSATKLTGEKQAEGSDFQDGRARYWVTGPGSFQVASTFRRRGTAPSSIR